jgi:hypothetical protein
MSPPAPDFQQLLLETLAERAERHLPMVALCDAQEPRPSAALRLAELEGLSN